MSESQKASAYDIYYGDGDSEYSDARYASPGQTETIDSLYEKLNADEDKSSGRRKKKVSAKKSSKGIFVRGALIFCTGVAAIAIAVPVILRSPFGSKVRVEKAIAEFASDMENTSEKTISAHEMEEMINMVMYGDSHMKYSLNVSGIEQLPVTLGVDGETTRFFDERIMESSDTLSVMNYDISEMEIVASDNDLYLYIPAFSDSYYMVDTENFAEQVNGSEITGMLGITVPEGDYRPFGDGISKDIHLTTGEAFAEKYSDEIQVITENMQVKRLADETEVELINGDTVNCRTYRVIIPNEYADSLLSSVIIDELYRNPMWAERIAGEDGTIDSIEVEKDIELELQIDTSGHIRAIDTASAIQITGAAFEIHAEYTGDKHVTDAMTVSVKSKTVIAGRNNLELTKVVSDDGYVQVNAYVSGDYEAGFSFDGYLDYSNSGELQADINKLGVSYEGKDVVRVSGDIDIEPAKKKASEIEIPQGNTVDLFNMSILDMLGIASDLGSSWDSLKDLYSLFGGLF